ncbi:MAG: peptidyl-prolyl cis-trans isomerase [Acidobacteria bacterium]|nr:peptidyl-prolyl cis-trans isomerase [Acidobacteriota bacterium]
MEARKIVMILLASVILSGAIVWAQEPAPPAENKRELTDQELVAKIGDRTVTLAEIKAEFARIPPQFVAHFNTPEKKEQYVRNLVDRSLFSMEAKAQGYMEQPDVQEKINSYVDRVLYAEFMKNMTQDIQVTEADCRKYYEDHPEEFAEQERIKASHILVKTEEEANQVKAELNQGGDWNELAKKYSSERGTRDRGGDLGYFSRNRMPAEFESVAFAMNPGEISDPIKTPLGYHIIRLEDKKPAEQSPFDEVKARIQNKLMSEMRQQKVDGIREQLFKKYNVEIFTDKIDEIQVGSGQASSPMRGRSMPVRMSPKSKPDEEKEKK